MLNDQLKNQILPWQEKGRWYHAFVESDGSAITITEKDDIDFTMSGALLMLPAGYRVLQWVVDADNDTSANADINVKKKVFTNGTQGVYLPTATQFTAADVWVFAYKE